MWLSLVGEISLNVTWTSGFLWVRGDNMRSTTTSSGHNLLKQFHKLSDRFRRPQISVGPLVNWLLASRVQYYLGHSWRVEQQSQAVISHLTFHQSSQVYFSSGDVNNKLEIRVSNFCLEVRYWSVIMMRVCNSEAKKARVSTPQFRNWVEKKMAVYELSFVEIHCKTWQLTERDVLKPRDLQTKWELHYLAVISDTQICLLNLKTGIFFLRLIKKKLFDAASKKRGPAIAYILFLNGVNLSQFLQWPNQMNPNDMSGAQLRTLCTRGLLQKCGTTEQKNYYSKKETWVAQHNLFSFYVKMYRVLWKYLLRKKKKTKTNE